MKKQKEKTKRRWQYFAMSILALIGLMLFLSEPIGAVGVMSAMALTVGSVTLEGETAEMYKALEQTIKSELEKHSKGYVSKTHVEEAIASALKQHKFDLKDDETIKELNSILERHGLSIKGLMESKGKEITKFSLKEALHKSFRDENTAKELDMLRSRKYERVNIMEVKAVGDITTGSVTTTTGGNALLDLINTTDVSLIRLAESFVENFATVTNTSQPVYTYADYIPKEGDVGFVGEKGKKPQLDFKVEVRSATAKKAAAYEILTTEALQDIPRVESVAETILLRKYLLKRQDGILFGDGVGENPLGVTKIAQAFNPVTWAGEKIIMPNLLDVIRAIANQVYTAKSWDDDAEFMPNVAYVNPTDWFAFIGTKTSAGMYVFPQLTFGENNSIDNFAVIPKNKIPAGKVLMGDFSKLNVVNYINYSVSQGWINEQFIHNMITLLGEGRFFTFVREYEKRAFVYDTIANVATGIKSV